MTTLDQNYIATRSLTEYFVNKTTGEPITGGYILFRKDNDRSTGKLVYQITGSPPNYEFTALPNPMTISVGSPMNGDNPAQNVTIYYYPFDENGELDLYYIEIYDEDGILQKELEAWPPNVDTSVSPGELSNVVENQISNSQFIDIDFEQEYGTTIDISGPVEALEAQVAPDWVLRISANGAGSILVNRTPLAGSLNIETNPPYRLDILPEGGTITSLQLVQRFNSNPDIWANEFVNGGVLVTTTDGISHPIVLSYSPSVAPSPTVIVEGDTGVSGYTYLTDTVAIDTGVNTDEPPDGYVEIILTLPTNGGVGITSVQICGLNANQLVGYDEVTVNRQEDHLFHYYNPLLQAIPVPSILQGWDFRVNPAQWGSTIAMGAVESEYLWDQLIGFQSVVSSVTASRRSPRSLNINLSTTGQFALIQYLGSSQLRQLLSGTSSVLIKAFTDLADGINGTVSLWVTTDSSLPDVFPTTNQSLVATLDANGKPETFHGSWTEIPRFYRGDAKFTIPYDAGGVMQTIALEGWNAVSVASDMGATFGAIVVGFGEAAASNVAFESISLTPGLIAVPVSSLSYGLTLNELEAYYEKSYSQDINPGAIIEGGALTFIMPMTTLPAVVPGEIDTVTFNGPFNIIFKQESRTSNAIVSIYSPVSGTAGFVRTVTLVGVLDDPFVESSSADFSTSSWTEFLGSGGVYYQPNEAKKLGETLGELGKTETFIKFHYTKDARYGVV